MKWIPWEYGLRNLGRSPLRAALTALGAMLVVGLILAAGSFLAGIERQLASTGDEGNILIIGKSSQESMLRSEIPLKLDTVARGDITGIQERFGVQYVSPEILFMPALKLTKKDYKSHQMILRGVVPAAALVHPKVRVVEGRFPAGGDELMIGALTPVQLQTTHERLAIGEKLYFDDNAWTIVGKFEAPGTVFETEMWAPMTSLKAASKREGISTLVVSADADGLSDAKMMAGRLINDEIVAMTEKEYYANTGKFYEPIRIMVWATAGLIAMGALLGGLNTMYAAFAARVREMATLQVLGYSRVAVAVSLLQESLLATAAGGLIACGLGKLFLDGTAVRFSTGAITLNVDASAILIALLAGILLGIAGALLPAWRCLRRPIPDALRAA
ncbi:MAG: ABC transporter permease [Phycisphaerales bacterium]|jgi:putative ABC transport system permease protein|nr:ABC transporter permease [Phycisphaerales bacterium]MBT7172029.1 ABC transporter permease [Phycisphaerales bacterium]